jgi:hypothetical protein
MDEVVVVITASRGFADVGELVLGCKCHGRGLPQGVETTRSIAPVVEP